MPQPPNELGPEDRVEVPRVRPQGAMCMPAGPQSGSASTNYPRGIESGVNWCTGFLTYLWAHGCIRAEATLEAEEGWTTHVRQMYSTMLMRKAQSWFTGYNSNVEGHEHGKIRYLVYNGGSPKYVATLKEVAEKGYEGIALTAGPTSAAPGHGARLAAPAGEVRMACTTAHAIRTAQDTYEQR